MKIQINTETIKEIKAVLDEHSDREKVVRIFEAGRSCSGSSYGLALDPLAEGDVVHDCGDFKIIMSGELAGDHDDWIVEFKEGGFLVVPANMQGGCGSCNCGCQ